MKELAARHGYDMEGNSLSESDEGYTEDGSHTESEFQSGKYQAPADQTSSESRQETGSQGGASFSGSGEGAKNPSRFSRHRHSHVDRHRGVSFEEMESIFGVLVSAHNCLC